MKQKRGPTPPEQPVKKTTQWVLASLRVEVSSWPADVKEEMGGQLNKVEYGGVPDDFKPMKTIGMGVNEIRVSEDGDQYRLIYVAKFEEAIYVLHVITKKKTQKTEKADIDKAKARYGKLLEWRKQQKIMKAPAKHEEEEEEEVFSPVGSGDIFQDFGFSEEESARLTIKACLFRKLQTALKEQAITQVELSQKLKIPQPKVSDILNGKMAGYSVERIATLLLRLNYVISLDAHPAPAGTCARVVDVAAKKHLV